jgi:hypothetical protein
MCSLADLGLDEHECLDHETSYGRWFWGSMTRATIPARFLRRRGGQPGLALVAVGTDPDGHRVGTAL